MSELEHSTAAVSSRRRWLMLATIGVALVVLALVVVALVIFAKEQFKDLVGPSFLPIITSGVFLGAILLIVAAWKLPERKNNNWRAFFLMVWGLVAITSPAFGLMFLFPWGLLALTLPVVISILITLSRATPA
jgi:drug/metabolite transporter (DMT)-like permease